jgi:glycosyltransferase involved in cell wall biosynthesis
MKKKVLFIADWPDSFENAPVLQALLNKEFSGEYEWTVWSCKRKIESGVWYRWRCYTKGALYAIRNRKKYDAIFIWQQMVAYILLELRRFLPLNIPPVVFYTFIYNSDSVFRKYKKHMVGNALKYAKGVMWDSEEIKDEVNKDFPRYSGKNYYTISPIFEVVNDYPVDKSLDDPAFRNGVYTAGATERDFNIVIRAFRNTNVPVTIVCRNDYAITEKDISSNIRVLRFAQVSHDQYYALVKQAFCVLNSVINQKSSGGLLLLHYAMIQSKPIISTNCAGIKDLIVDNETGLLFQPGHEEPILHAYQKLKNDAFFAEKLIENAKKAAKKMSPQGFIPEVISIIEN